MYQKGSIRRTVRGEEQYFTGIFWKSFPKNTYDGETRYKKIWPYRIKIDWETQHVFLISRWKNSEFFFHREQFIKVWIRDHVYLFQLSEDNYLFVGSGVFHLSIPETIQRIISEKDPFGQNAVAIYTKDFVYIFDRTWKKIERKGLEIASTQSEENDPFFLKDELPYKLHFLSFDPKKLVKDPHWYNKIQVRLPMFHRSTSISGSLVRLDHKYSAKYFEFTENIPLYIQEWLIQNIELSRGILKSKSRRYRHFILFGRDSIAGYLVLVEHLKHGSTCFHQILCQPFLLWNPDWTKSILEFLNQHFISIEWMN